MTGGATGGSTSVPLAGKKRPFTANCISLSVMQGAAGTDQSRSSPGYNSVWPSWSAMNLLRRGGSCSVRIFLRSLMICLRIGHLKSFEKASAILATTLPWIWILMWSLGMSSSSTSTLKAGKRRPSGIAWVVKLRTVLMVMCDMSAWTEPLAVMMLSLYLKSEEEKLLERLSIASSTPFLSGRLMIYTFDAESTIENLFPWR
mmetsp:Transcript_31675/g.48472  ORF Transcript_31675/g.48472 Transcript_31675/m.48472 type:complete len:202 (-) Transcript_31675:176-781(-)